MLVYKRCLTAICLLACCATLRAHGGHGVSGPSASHGSHHHSTQVAACVMLVLASGAPERKLVTKSRLVLTHQRCMQLPRTTGL